MAVLKVLLLLLPLVTAAPCPRTCSCPQLAELHCTFRSLPAVPASVPGHVERMNLGFNSITKITEKSFAGLGKLELLMVHGNEIQSIPDGAFRDLASLQMLKMSYNKLTEITRRSLEGLWSLARLHLDHNRLEFIHPDTFQGLASLRLLQLEGNRLRRLHPATFATFTLLGHFHVSTLKHLHLSDNRLTALSPGLLATMPGLENLYLHGNPWACDCNMRWFQDWSQTSQGVLKCKKDRALPGGQLCPLCSSPKHLQSKELNSVESLVCSRPLISTPARATPPEDAEDSEVLTSSDFGEPFGNVSLGLSDEHGNEVDLECSIWEPKGPVGVNWEQVDSGRLLANLSLSVDLECLVDREKYEQLWRLIAYYSSVPAHLERGIILSKDPHLTYVFRQDSEKDALYYTGVKVNMMARPDWLMQTSVDLQLNRLQSSAKMVKLTLGMSLSETVEVEAARGQGRPWVTVGSMNATGQLLTAVLGSPTQLNCDARGSGQPRIQWVLPDGSRLDAPGSRPDKTASVSGDGRLLLHAVGHTHAGTYYCVSRIRGDFAVLPFRLTVHELPGPLAGETTSTPPYEGFVGNPVSLPCVASGSPDAEITWILPNGKIVGFQANSSRAVVYPNGTLHIPQLQPSDGGYYKCIVMNQHGVDAIASKVSVARHKGLLKPLRKLKAQPQSASGVNTQIKVLTGDAEGASGDGDEEETPRGHQDPFRRRVPGGVAVGRRVVHPSRSAPRRPPLLRRPADRQSAIENRRRVTMSKSKIDPEKWADILAKIRDKNARVTATPPQGWNAMARTTEASSFTEAHTPAQHTPRESDEYSHRSQGSHVTSNGYTTQNMFDIASNSQRAHSTYTTTQPHITQSAHNVQYTNLDPHTSSNSVFFLPRTTSASLRAVTVWQASANPDVGRVQTAVGSEEGDRSDVTTNRDLNESATSKEREEKDPGKASKSPTATPTKAAAPEELSPSRFWNSRRRNGGRKRGPNRRKHKPSGSTVASRPSVTSQPSTLLVQVTTDALGATVPFVSDRVTSAGRLSHEENTVARRDHEAPTQTSPRDPSPETKHRQAKPTQFPTTSPGGGRRAVSSPAALEPPHGTVPPRRPAPTEQGPMSAAPSSNQPSEASAEEEPELRPDPESTFGGDAKTDVRGTSASASSPEDLEVKSTSGSPPLITTPNSRFKDYLTEQASTTTEASYQDLNHPKSSESVVDGSIGGNNDDLIGITSTTRPPSSTLVTPILSIPPTVAQHVPDAEIHPSGKTSVTTVNQSQTLQTASTGAEKTPDLHPTTVSSYPGSTGASAGPQTDVRTSSPSLTVTPMEAVVAPTNGRDVSGRHQLPAWGSVPRGKPRIMKNNFQTFTVKAETDARLPCEAQGEPMPFLSWIKVSTGASIAQNTRVQRFEVHQNGTLIIRATQLTDGGQYLCTVQNQYGTDKMAVNLAVLSQHPRVLQPRHRDAAVPLGGTIDLPCEAEGHPVPRITWVLPNHVHVTAADAAPAGGLAQRRVSALTDGTLRISRADYGDRGVYKCIGSSVAGADSVSVRLHVSTPPPAIQQMSEENATLAEGASAYLHCAHGHLVRWITPHGTQLVASQLATGRNLFVFPNGTLYIRELGPGNAGRYECLAIDSRRTVNLSVRRNRFSAKASITSSSPLKTDVIYGTKVVLDCLAKGQPEPRIIWRTPSKKLVDVQYSFDPRIKVFPNGSLAIHSVTEKDGGDYLCVARNKAGDDYVLLRVDVLTRAAKIERKLQRSSQEVVSGGDLKVDCVASGLPNPEISWALPDGTMVNLEKQKNGIGAGRSRRYVVFDNGTLYLNEVGTPEEGDYTCYAENQLGKDEMKVRVKIKAGGFPPQIQEKDPKGVSVYYGETITLGCRAQGQPVPVITWISPTNRVIAPALDKYQVLDDGTLVVQKVQRFDAGNYTCLARNNAGHDHKVVRLEVLVTPPVINGLRGTASAIKVDAVQDQLKLVDCVAKGTPAPRIMWVLPGNVILPAPYYSSRMSVHLNGTLEIRSPKRMDSGQLVCIARNEGGEVRMVVDFNVKEAFVRPQALRPSGDGQSLTVGNIMTLNCSLEGMTLSHITWILPNGTPLLSGARYSKFFHRPDGSLVISNPSVAEVGTYQCLGRHSGGLVERTVTLSPGRKPEINNRYDTPVSVMNGENLQLHCQTTGKPLRLAWTLPSGVVLNRPQRAGRYTILPNGTLAIQQVSVYDRGPYVCRAGNEYGSSLLSVSVIVIAYPPRITSGPPSVTYAKRGVAVQLNCVAAGIPQVEVAWETPDRMRLAVSGQPRLIGNKYLHPQGSLVIQNPTPRDAGVYRCTARNAVGVDTKATFLNVF